MGDTALEATFFAVTMDLPHQIHRGSLLRFTLPQAPGDLTNGLLESFFIFNEAHPDKPFTCRPKTGAGTHGDMSLFEQLHGEVHCGDF